MKNKSILLIIIIFLVFCFVVFYKGLNDSNIYSPNIKDKKTIPFFNLGPKNDWKNLLNTKVKLKIEPAFKNEMKPLNYL